MNIKITKMTLEEIGKIPIIHKVGDKLFNTGGRNGEIEPTKLADGEVGYVYSMHTLVPEANICFIVAEFGDYHMVALYTESEVYSIRRSYAELRNSGLTALAAFQVLVL